MSTITANRLKDAKLSKDMEDLCQNYQDFQTTRRRQSTKEKDRLKEAKLYLNNYRGNKEVILHQIDYLRRLGYYEMNHRSILAAQDMWHEYKAKDMSVLTEFKTPSPRNIKHHKDVRSSFFLSLNSSEIEERVHNTQHYERPATCDELEYINNSNPSFTETAAKYKHETTTLVYPTQSSKSFAKTSLPKYHFVDATVKFEPLHGKCAIACDDSRPDQEVKQSLKSVREQLFDLDAKLAAISMSKTIKNSINSEKDISKDAKSISTEDMTDNSFTNNSEVDDDDDISSTLTLSESSLREHIGTTNSKSKNCTLIEATNNLYANEINVSPMMQKEDECQACVIM
jgi:hypothetical protein